MQPQKNRSTSRQHEEWKVPQAPDWTPSTRPSWYAVVRRPVQLQASRDGVDNPVSRHSSIGLAGAAL